MPKFYSLDESFSLEGIWWVPSEPKLEQKRGVLTFEPGQRITLQLEGFLALSSESFLVIGRFAREGHQVIKGTTETGESVLLFDNQNQTFNCFFPRLVLISDDEIPWNTPDEITFRRLMARYTYLEDWRGVFPFDDEREDDENHQLSQVSLKYVAPSPIIVPVTTLDAEIRFVPRADWSVRQTETSIRYRMFAEVVASEPRHINWLIEQLQHVQDLLTFLIGQPIRKLAMRAVLDSSATGTEVGQTVHVLHSVPIPTPLKTLSPNSMLSARLVGENLQNVIVSWFRPEMFEIWEAIRDVYFGVFYDALRITRFQFLALTQVLESYHRKKMGGEYLSEEEYEPIKEALVEAIPQGVAPDHRNSLKDRIKYGYQYSQRKRFSQLMCLLDENLQGILGIRSTDTRYQKRIFATRNYFTHYEADDESLLFNERELMQANSRLAHMIATLILRAELEIPAQQIAVFLENRMALGYLW